MNQKRYWLRGGVTLAIIFAVWFIIIWSEDFVGQKDALAFSMAVDVLTLPAHLFGIPHNVSFYTHYDIVTKTHSFFNMSIILMLGIVFYFMIGGLLGWIYGKIKNRNLN